MGCSEMLLSMQVLVLHVEGRVLTPDQLRAGDYVLPSELPLAQRLVDEADWAAHSSSQQADAQQPLGQSAHNAFFHADQVGCRLLSSPNARSSSQQARVQQLPGQFASTVCCNGKQADRSSVCVMFRTVQDIHNSSQQADAALRSACAD